MDIALFLGRFHPLVVHLPIGFLILASIMEMVSRVLSKKSKSLDDAISLALLCGGLGAIASAVIGYLLSTEGGYDPDTLFWHQWLGISVAVISLIGWVVKTQKSVPKIVSSGIIAGLIILVSITGHLGGNLTHGEEYLFQYAPPFAKKLAGMEVRTNEELEALPKTPDSLIVFKHLIRPILEAKCYACHNESKAQGGLMMATKEGLEKGGDHGGVIHHGEALSSELFVRTTLAHGDTKFMPPKGKPLTYSEQKLLEWWISTGASFEAVVSQSEVDEEIEYLLMRDYALDTRDKPFYDRVTVPQLNEEVIADVIAQGFSVKTLSAQHNLIDVKPLTETVSVEQIKTLESVSEQVIWLNLGGKEVNDEMLSIIAAFPNLMVLRLDNNPISDQGIRYLTKLKNLEVLNLYGTSVSDQALETIRSFSNLKKLYLWQTKVSKEAINALEKDIPNLKIIDE